MMKWISVEKVYPESFVSVLVYSQHNNDDIMHVAFYNDESNEWLIQLESPEGFFDKKNRVGVATLNFVTHWMPLPDAPEEEV